MRIDIDDVFDQIINIQVNDTAECKLKDIKLDLKDEYEYEIAINYTDAYAYLCDCLMLDQENNNSQKLLDLFLVHQYLCFCYLSEDKIDHLLEEVGDQETAIDIVKECFFCYRVAGAFQACIAQYEILKQSSLWDKLDCLDQMEIMKDSAKSYRNTGDFIHALKLYYDCLTLNPRQDWLQKVELLLKIGKVYRNYLMQIELARFYVEEAYTLLTENQTQSLDKEREWRYAVICFDTLGQIYRDEQNFEKAREFFDKSKKLYGEKGGRARIHEILMKYQSSEEYTEPDLAKDIEFLVQVISGLEQKPFEEIGVGVRSVQLGRLKFKNTEKERREAYEAVKRGRQVAYKYNDMKTVIRSYMEEANFFKQEKRYADYIRVSTIAIKLAADSNQLVLENKIIKEIIEFSNDEPDIIDSSTKIELIKHRKAIYKKLVAFSRYSIDFVRTSTIVLFSKDKLIDMYGIVLDDFEQILGELSSIIEILNIEIEKINQKYIAYLNTEIKGSTYKSILHKFKNDLPDEATINRLRLLCGDRQFDQREGREILPEVNKQLETFANIITHIKHSANEALKESELEKRWCSLDKLIRTGIQNFVYCKPQYENIIQYSQAEQGIEIMTQSTLFETTISEILNNAFAYMESVIDEKEIGEKFRFEIDLKIIGKRAVVLECCSRYEDSEIAEKAERSIKNGLERRQSTKKEGSRYGFHSMKFLFEDLMGGKIQVLKGKNKAGISIHLPINLVTLRMEEGGRRYE